MSATSRQDYICAVLTAYAELPDTPRCARPSDRTLAGQLYDRDVPLELVRDALILTYARRTLRPPDAPPLPQVRSLYYFLPVIEELLQRPLPAHYIHYIRDKLRRLAADPCPENRVSS